MFQQTNAGAMVPGGAWHGEWQGWGQTAADPHGQMERDRLARLGRALLGWVEVPYQNGAHVSFHWQRTQPEQVGELPAAAVATARDAALAEEEARRAMAEAAQTLRAWLARNQPADGRPHPQHAAAYAEAVTAHREAEAEAQRTLAKLGEVAERAAAARQMLASAPQRRTAAEQAYTAALRQVDQDEQAARAELDALFK